MTHASTRKLMDDLRTVVADAEALLSATAHDASDRARDARSAPAESVEQARKRLEELEEEHQGARQGRGRRRQPLRPRQPLAVDRHRRGGRRRRRPAARTALSRERGAGPDAGLFASLRRMLATLIDARADAARARLRSRSRSSCERAAAVLLWSIAAIFFASLTVLLLALTIVIAFWDEHRLLAAGARDRDLRADRARRGARAAAPAARPARGCSRR